MRGGAGWGMVAAAGLAAASAFALLGLAGAGPAAGEPALTLDGRCLEPAYRLVALDPLDLELDLPEDQKPPYLWAELTELWATSDINHLWVCVPLPGYRFGTSSGQVGLVIDTTGDVANSGGSIDPLAESLSFSYQATRASLASVPLTFSEVVLPDFLIRGQIPGIAAGGDDNNGYSDLFGWASAGWTATNTNWGGIQKPGLVGNRIAYFDGPEGGTELQVAYSELGLQPDAPLRLQFFTASKLDLFRPFVPLDTLPPDAQVSVPGAPAELHYLAEFVPGEPRVAFAQPGFQAAESAGSVPVTVSLSAAQVLTVSVTLSTSIASPAGAANHAPAMLPVELRPGLTQAVALVGVSDDAEADGNEIIALALVEAVGVALGEPAVAELIVLDDDPPGPGARLFIPLLSRP